MKIKRAIILSHFDRDNVIDEYVVNYLRCLAEVSDHLIMVSTSALADRELSKVRDICDRTVVRDNVGYDFMSYREGLRHIDTSDYDEVVLCNDSVYGPLFPLSEMFQSMQEEGCDFWGVTECREISYHLQSYFLVFRSRALESGVFKAFWEELIPLGKKWEIINKYEIGLSRRLLEHGLRSGVYVSYHPNVISLLALVFLRFLRAVYANLSEKKKRTGKREKIKNRFRNVMRFISGTYNPTHFFWSQIIRERGMPFVKIELLRDNPKKMKTGGWETFINRLSDYDTGYISHHLGRMLKHCDSP